jgi:hypothetical protein
VGEWEHNVVDNVVDEDDDDDDEDENVANGDVEEDEVQDDDVWGKEKSITAYFLPKWLPQSAKRFELPLT